MKKFLTLIALPLVGCSIGGVELTKESILCDLNGQSFVPGETVALADSCNACICSTTGALENCTQKDCEELVGLANPAAVKCSVDGFTYEIREDAEGNQFGVCVDEQNLECDAWAYSRDECALGEAATPEPEIVIDETGSADETVVDEQVSESDSPNEDVPAEIAN